MKLVASFLLAALAAFVVTRAITLRKLPSGAGHPVSVKSAAPSDPGQAPSPNATPELEAATITRELAHRSGPLLLPPQPFGPDGSVSWGLARLLGLNREERQALNGRLRELADRATLARIQAAKLVATTDESVSVYSPRQVALGQELESAYERAISSAIGAEARGWLEQQEGLVAKAARQATGFLKSTDTTWNVQKVSSSTSAAPARYVLITLSAESADNVAQSSTFFDRLEMLEPVTREVLQRNLPAKFLEQTP